MSLRSEKDFSLLKIVMDGMLVRSVLLILFWAFWHHFFAGLRHLAMDFHLGMALEQARFTSKVVLILSLIFTIFSLYLVC